MTWTTCGEMAVTECPIPSVATALDAFIKPRDEVAAIRQNLQAYLYHACDNDSPRLSAMTIREKVLPHDVAPVSSLSGVRKAYWRALQAHSAAQNKYDAMKADLHQLRSPSSQDQPTHVIAESVDDYYLPLLRLRESLRRLQVLDQAFSDIASTGNASSSNSVEGVVRRRNGEPPAAPQSDAAAYRQGPDVEGRILQLKKAVLTTRRQVDDFSEDHIASPTKQSQNGLGEVAGLQGALNELTVWMETQLGLIAGADTDTQLAVDTPLPNGRDTPEAASLEDIADLYDHYLTARETLIHTINNPSSLEAVEASTIFASSSRMSRSKDTDKRKTPSELLLPHITSLETAKEQEQSLLEQSAYLRRQISTAESETDRLIARLADESHLVPPGAACGKDWTNAAVSVGDKTKTIVRERSSAGEVFVTSAAQALENINIVPLMMKELVEVEGRSC